MKPEPPTPKHSEVGCTLRALANAQGETLAGLLRLVGKRDGGLQAFVSATSKSMIGLAAYVDRIIVWMGGEVVANHHRFFCRDWTVYNQWRHLPVLTPVVGLHRHRVSVHLLHRTIGRATPIEAGTFFHEVYRTRSASEARAYGQIGSVIANELGVGFG